MREENIRNRKWKKEFARLRMLITKCPQRSVSEANDYLCRNLMDLGAPVPENA